jgi:hypothetical protein
MPHDEHTVGSSRLAEVPIAQLLFEPWHGSVVRPLQLDRNPDHPWLVRGYQEEVGAVAPPFEGLSDQLHAHRRTRDVESVL